ncbi:hypothetical protein OUZ56_006622 [Daphnia magna]|uniref:Secreted protein n=1 Tax=Daphnia magna TaxID=35525 RepID=A0ABQ9YW74_9CRUS|nr:hypothetical protein OUZ56_006622 [Daphnia magna]
MKMVCSSSFFFFFLPQQEIEARKKCFLVVLLPPRAEPCGGTFSHFHEERQAYEDKKKSPFLSLFFLASTKNWTSQPKACRYREMMMMMVIQEPTQTSIVTTALNSLN